MRKWRCRQNVVLRNNNEPRTCTTERISLRMRRDGRAERPHRTMRRERLTVTLRSTRLHQISTAATRAPSPARAASSQGTCAESRSATRATRPPVVGASRSLRPASSVVEGSCGPSPLQGERAARCGAERSARIGGRGSATNAPVACSSVSYAPCCIRVTVPCSEWTAPTNAFDSSSCRHRKLMRTCWWRTSARDEGAPSW